MVLDGGVAGAEPLHKGGRLRPTAKTTVESGERFVRGVAGGNGGSETLAQG